MLRTLCTIALLSLSAWAQTPDTATIRGQVIDASQGAIPHAQVTATNTLTGAKRTVETDGSGAFTLSGLPSPAPTI
jgi:hypothetical protein